MTASLLAPEPGDGAQAFLFSELPAQVIERVLFREERGEYTAVRFFSQHRKMYEACVRLLGMGMTVQGIAEALCVSDNTVRAVRERESAAVADFHAKQGKRRLAFMARALDRMEKTIDEADLKDATVSYAIIVDKHQLLTGGPTSIIGTPAKPGTEAFKEWISKNGVTLDVPMTVETPGTGLEGGEPGQRGVPPAGDPGPGDGASGAETD